VEGGVSLCNATGRAEHISLSAEYGTESSSQFALAYEQPRIAGLPATVGGGGWGAAGVRSMGTNYWVCDVPTAS
jgi:hypothetical protein